MSQEIYFVKGKNLSTEEINTIIESDAVPTDSYIVSKELKEKLIKDFVNLGLEFEEFSSDGYLELNFDTFQISMFDGSVVLSIPYWDRNSAKSSDFQLITNVLLDAGFIGFDAQTEKFITQKYEIQKPWVVTTAKAETKSSEKASKNSLFFIYSISGVIIAVSAILIWRFFKK